MLVSDSHKLVFVHIQKTGGSTVHRLLEERIPDLRSILTRHGFASRGKQELDGWNDYYKFALVRNPWERLVFRYSMVTTYPRGGNEPWRYVCDNSSNFREFTYNCTDEIRIKKGVYYSFAYNQLDYLTDEDGDLLVDFICRLENFDEGVHKVSNRIGVDPEVVPHKNRSRHQHHSRFYTPDTEMIGSGEVLQQLWTRDQLGSLPELTPPSMPEVRRVIRAVMGPEEQWEFRLGWSLFRRVHQAVAKRSHKATHRAIHATEHHADEHDDSRRGGEPYPAESSESSETTALTTLTHAPKPGLLTDELWECVRAITNGEAGPGTPETR